MSRRALVDSQSCLSLSQSSEYSTGKIEDSSTNCNYVQYGSDFFKNNFFGTPPLSCLIILKCCKCSTHHAFSATAECLACPCGGGGGEASPA